jgi:hypothetical protein
MSRRLRMNSKRVIAMRKAPERVAHLMKIGRGVMDRANADFYATASDEDRGAQDHAASSETPYDMSVRIGSDRARVYVQTASLAARRHENSTRGSSLLRGLREG